MKVQKSTWNFPSPTWILPALLALVLSGCPETPAPVGDVYKDGAPTFSVQPTSIRPAPGEKFTVRIHVDPRDNPINGVSFEVSFDPEVLKVESVGLAGSLAGRLANGSGTPKIDNRKGVVRLEAKARDSAHGRAAPEEVCNITFSLKRDVSEREATIRIARASLIGADGRELDEVSRLSGAVQRRFFEDEQVVFDRGTRLPSKVTQIRAFPPALKDGAVRMTEGKAEEAFRGFLDKYFRLFQVPTENLKLDSIRRIDKRWVAKFQQTYQGVPVYHSTVGLIAAANGEIESYASNYQPDIQVSIKPKLDLERAVAVARGTYEAGAAAAFVPRFEELLIYPQRDGDRVSYHLAWKFMLAGKVPNPSLDAYFIVDAHDGTVLHSYPRYMPANVRGTLLGEIYPENPAAPPVSNEPLSHLTVEVEGSKTRTDTAGGYSVSGMSNGIHPATFTLEGPYARVRESNGNDIVAAVNCNTNADCDVTWIMADGDGINVFYQMNLLHDWYQAHLGYSWINPWEGGQQFTAEVNHTYSNAYAGDPILFGVNPFARSSDVIYHECTHNVLYQLYGDWVGASDNDHGEGYAFDEGFGDYFANTLTDESIQGEGVGPGRDQDNNLQYPGKANYNIEGHTGGRYIGGAMWDLRTSLVEEMGHDAGVLAADKLAFEAHQLMASQPRKYYFSDPQESNFLTALYLADDTNGDLTDGVPHFVEIHRAFAGHGMLQAVLWTGQGYDVSANRVGLASGGDFYLAANLLMAKSTGQRGVIDLGDAGDLDLASVDIPSSGYTQMGVTAIPGNTYVALAGKGEKGNVIALRVLGVNTAIVPSVTLEYYYHSRMVTLADQDSYDFDEQLRRKVSGGDFYVSGGKFWSDSIGQRGVQEIGDLGATPLESVDIPKTGYTQTGVMAHPGHTYVALAAAGEEGHYVVFRVTKIAGTEVTLETVYKRRNRVVLYEGDGYDFSTRMRGGTHYGDFFLSNKKFWSNNTGQMGLVDVGFTGATPLSGVTLPASGYYGGGIAVNAGHTYVARAAEGEPLTYVVFRVDSIHGEAAIIDYEVVVAPDQYEPGSDNAETAPDAKCGETYMELSLHSPSDVDFFRLTVLNPQGVPAFGWGTGVTVSVTSKTPGIESILLDGSLHPVTPVKASAFLVPSYTYALETGTYYVRVSGGGTPGGYKLEINCGAFHWKFRKPLVRIDDPLIIIPEAWLRERHVVLVSSHDCPGDARGQCVNDSYAFSVEDGGVRNLRIAASRALLDVVVRRVDVRNPEMRQERRTEEVARAHGQREYRLGHPVEPGYMYVVTVTSRAREDFSYTLETLR